MKYRTHNRNATTKGKGLGIRFKICLFYNYTLLKYGHTTLDQKFMFKFYLLPVLRHMDSYLRVVHVDLLGRPT